jgi:hypothetical protein
MGQAGVLYMQHFRGDWLTTKLPAAEVGWVLAMLLMSFTALGIAAMQHHVFSKKG